MEAPTVCIELAASDRNLQGRSLLSAGRRLDRLAFAAVLWTLEHSVMVTQDTADCVRVGHSTQGKQAGLGDQGSASKAISSPGAVTRA